MAIGAGIRDSHTAGRRLSFIGRARDELMVTGVEPGSEFLADMG